MATQNDLHIRVRQTGAEPTRRSLEGVRGAVRGVGGATRGIFGTLLGGSFLATILGGSLLGLALSGGGASNTMIRLRSVMEDLLSPFAELLRRGLELFLLMPEWAQQATALSIALLGVAFALSATLGPLVPYIAAVGLLGAGFYLLYTRSEGFRNAFTYIANDIIRTINDLIQGFRHLVAVGYTALNFPTNPADIDDVYKRGLQIIPDFSFGTIGTPSRTSPFVTQPGQSPFSLTPFEQSAVNLFTTGARGEQLGGGAVPQNYNYFFGNSPEQTIRELQRGLSDPNVLDRASGGP